MFDSTTYWEKRYASGRNSGEGSYNTSAKWKADNINKFIKENGIKTIGDLGTGDGNQFSLFSGYEMYYGFDVSKIIIDRVSKQFKHNLKAKFSNLIEDMPLVDLTISLDVLFHLIDKEVYIKYIETLFSKSKEYVIVYARNKSCQGASHYKCREFIKDIQNIIGIPPFKIIPIPPNISKRGISYNDFVFYQKGEIK